MSEGGWPSVRESYERLRNALKEVDSGRLWFEIRVDGACLAMSRFMTWVWMEASWRAHADVTHGLLVKEAIERGLLRVEWPR